jgi:hypothetical protein
MANALILQAFQEDKGQFRRAIARIAAVRPGDDPALKHCSRKFGRVDPKNFSE